MKRTFLFISGLRRDMEGVTVCNTRHDQIKILIKLSLPSVPPLNGTLICCGAKKIMLLPMARIRSYVFPHLSDRASMILCY